MKESWEEKRKKWEKRYKKLVGYIEEQIDGISVGMDGFSYPNIYTKLDEFINQERSRLLRDLAKKAEELNRNFHYGQKVECYKCDYDLAIHDFLKLIKEYEV